MDLILSVIAGAICGLLINYFSDVLPVSRRLTRPLCPACGQPYTIMGTLFPHKCPHCGKRKSIRSAIVLIGGIILCVLLHFFPFSIFGFWATLPILIYLGVVLVIDIEHRLILIETSIPGFILFLIYGTILRGFLCTFLGALGGFAITLLFYFLGLAFNAIIGKLRHQKIDEVAFGFGDVSMGTILGLLTGWAAIVGTIIIAIAAFGVFSLVYILTLVISKRYQAFTSALPFAPFLILGAIAVFYL